MRNNSVQSITWYVRVCMCVCMCVCAPEQVEWSGGGGCECGETGSGEEGCVGPVLGG